VAVANSLPVDDVAHLHTGTQLATLGLGAEDTDLRIRQIIENDSRHVCQRPVRVFFQHEHGMLCSDLFHLALERRGDFPSKLIGNDGDPLLRLHSQAISDGITRAGLQFRIDLNGVGAVGHKVRERSALRENVSSAIHHPHRNST
jgi:hypothetical protein